MKLLFDQNISHRIIGRVSEHFPHSKQVRELGLEGCSDREIWEYAMENSFTIATFDGDFFDLSLVWGHPPKIIWLRTRNQSTQHILQGLITHKKDIMDFINDSNLSCLSLSL
jgi:predicted nuclease of predicted toxin-antitoxin system